MTLKSSRNKYEKSMLMKESTGKRVENIPTKGEIAQNKQFLLLSECFQNSSAAEAQ